MIQQPKNEEETVQAGDTADHAQAADAGEANGEDSQSQGEGSEESSHTRRHLKEAHQPKTQRTLRFGVTSTSAFMPSSTISESAPCESEENSCAVQGAM